MLTLDGVEPWRAGDITAVLCLVEHLCDGAREAEARQSAVRYVRPLPRWSVAVVVAVAGCWVVVGDSPIVDSPGVVVVVVIGCRSARTRGEQGARNGR